MTKKPCSSDEQKRISIIGFCCSGEIFFSVK
jgi:hypothetical protein